MYDGTDDDTTTESESLRRGIVSRNQMLHGAEDRGDGLEDVEGLEFSETPTGIRCAYSPTPKARECPSNNNRRDRR